MIHSEQNQKMTDFNYHQYSLEQLSNWMHDAMSAGEASAEEIYNTIKKVVEEQYYHHKHHASQAYELLALLNGNGIGHIKQYDDCVDKILSCNKDDQSPECKGAWNEFWENDTVEYELREAEYYNKEKPKTFDEMIASGYEMTADGFWIPPEKDKVNKWVLPVQVDGLTGDCYINLPDDLLEAADLKEGDQVEWVYNGDRSYTMRKVNVKQTNS
jgi:hypothetical protein